MTTTGPLRTETHINDRQFALHLRAVEREIIRMVCVPKMLIDPGDFNYNAAMRVCGGCRGSRLKPHVSGLHMKGIDS